VKSGALNASGTIVSSCVSSAFASGFSFNTCRKVQEMEEQKRHEAVEAAKQKAREELSKSCAEALEEAEQRFQQAQYDLESDTQLKVRNAPCSFLLSSSLLLFSCLKLSMSVLWQDEKIAELQKEIADLQAQKESLEMSTHEERERSDNVALSHSGLFFLVFHRPAESVCMHQNNQGA